MRKLLGIFAIFLLVGTVHAQGGTALELDTWVEGTLTNDVPSQSYVFTGTAGSIILAEAYPATFDSYLDATLAILDSAGQTLAANDDYVDFDPIVVVELPTDGEYTLVIGRSEFTQTEGVYRMRVRQISPMQPDSSATATIYADPIREPSLFVFRPELDGLWRIDFSRDSSGLFPALRLASWSGDFADEVIFDMSHTGNLLAGSLSVDLTGGKFYILIVQQSFYSTPEDQTETLIQFSFSQAE